MLILTMFSDGVIGFISERVFIGPYSTFMEVLTLLTDF